MKVLIVPDKFKGSLTAYEVIQAIEKGLENSLEDYQVNSFKLSDGGDGFLEAITSYIEVQKKIIPVVDPIGREILAPYLFDKEKGIAYIELARASGLLLLDEHERNPLKTSTRGTGMQILDAVKNGAKRIFIGLGGSATNDGGTGIAYELGYRFKDSNGKELEPKGEALVKIRSIISPYSRPIDVEFFALNDVNNPLYGKEGAAFVYAAQKGASSSQIIRLDEGLKQLNKVVKQEFKIDRSTLAGTGSAGGAAFGLVTFLNTSFIQGTDFLLRISGVENHIKNNTVDVIITGEGKLDSQTASGKLVSGIVKLAKKYGIPVVVVCGKNELSKKEQKEQGFETILEISDSSKPLKYNMQCAFELLTQSIEKHFKLQ